MHASVIAHNEAMQDLFPEGAAKACGVEVIGHSELVAQGAPYLRPERAYARMGFRFDVQHMPTLSQQQATRARHSGLSAHVLPWPGRLIQSRPGVMLAAN